MILHGHAMKAEKNSVENVELALIERKRLKQTG